MHHSRSRVACALALLLAACGSSSTSPSEPAPDATPAAAPDASTPAPPIDTPSAAGPMSVDCALSTGHCPALTIPADPAAPGTFHGYADPSLRKDPNSSTIYMAYSWADILTDPAQPALETINVELHLAHSSDLGLTWTADGPLFTSHPVTNPGGGNYAMQNQSSDEVIDLLPIDLGGSTMWIQAHMRYLVALNGRQPYTQINTTSYVSLSAIVAPAGASPQALLGLASAPEARLADTTTDATLQPTFDLSTLDGDHCTNFNQPALWFQDGKLYLILECQEQPASGDGKSESHYVYSTAPVGADATKWVWKAVGNFVTPTDAVHLGQAEGTPYQFLTEMQLMTGHDGQLLAVMNPGIVVADGVQPAIQYGCRAIPVTSLDPPAIAMTNGVPDVVASSIESDLYVSPNEGTGACSYDAASLTGMVMVRKLEADPKLGFYVTLQSTHLHP